MKNILDIYYRWPLYFDGIIVGIAMFINIRFNLIMVIVDRLRMSEIISDMIDTSVSLAGFILAALTIIVTFKSNIKSKGIDDSTNAFEMIFSSTHYKNIVTAFKHSIVELTILFISLYVVSLIVDNLKLNILFQVVVSGIIIISLSIFRSLLLLFKILSIELKAS